MQLKLIPVLLTLGLTTLLGACETVSENAPTQPGSQVDAPQGGAELDSTESPKYPPAPEAAPDDAIPGEVSPETSEIPAAPDAEVPGLTDDASESTDATDPQAP